MLCSRIAFAVLPLMSLCVISRAAEKPVSAPAIPVKVIDGIVQPRQPVPDAIAQAMQFLKKADGGYVPGRIDGELAGYFSSAFVNEDGSRSDREFCFPARQHAYFIFTFLLYHKRSGEAEWLGRARGLGGRNLSRSSPAIAAY